MAKIQFLPACLALNAAVIAGVLVITALFGRIYCSTICPLGVLQDTAIAFRRAADKSISKSRARKHLSPWHSKRFSFSRERKWLRYGVLALTIIALVAGIQCFVALIAPYSSYGRTVRAITGIGSPRTDTALLWIGLASFVLIIFLAVMFGRAWCSNICPVGTVLGSVSRFSLFRPRIDENKCTHCHACEKTCRAACIDSERVAIDSSRCVDCFDCLDACKSGAISFSALKRKPAQATAGNATKRKPAQADGHGTTEHKPAAPDSSRRGFLAATGIIAGTVLGAKAQNAAAKAMSAAGNTSGPKSEPERTTPIVPPGAVSAEHFYNRCTACQLCVSNCPNGVLRPTDDLMHFLQPHMSYENGFCRPECTRCSEICPTGAILPVERGRKTLIHIGYASVRKEDCIGCGKCADTCPMGAIKMYKADGKSLPAVAREQCIGCGKCEYLCPVRPVSAITVNGLEKHQEE